MPAVRPTAASPMSSRRSKNASPPWAAALEDPMQNLYLREPVPLPGWTILRETTNYRSPRDLLGFIRKIVGPEVRLDAGSPFDGSDVSVSTYEEGNPEEVIEATKRAIMQALSLGFRK